MKRLISTFRIACVTVLILALLLFAAVQFQQRLLRWRAERLMADMHNIRLYQSTWADAQMLMNRWGAWGHYDGDCTASECRYQITLSDLSYRRGVFGQAGFRLYSLFGGRTTSFNASFTVHSGTIWRESAGILVSASPRLLFRRDEIPLGLIVETKSRQRLRQTQGDWWIMGADDQLSAHPYYKAGRPGGCEINCEEAVVTYSTRTPPVEITRLTSFSFSCITQFFPCTELEQLLPAAREWHLYHEEENSATQHGYLPSRPCDIPLWAIARDTHHALIVEGLSTRIVKEPGFAFVEAKGTFENGPDFEKEEDKVRIMVPLKGTPPWAENTVVLAYPYEGINNVPALNEASEHLFPGKRYIVFPIGDDRRDQILTSDSPIELDRCGVWEDTPENRRELEKGLAQNDELRDERR